MARQAGSEASKAVLLFSVEDTGIGFDPAKTEQLFSPFIQADGSITRSFGGTGLGLAITRSLVHLMGGSINTQSQLGQGSTFSFSLQAAVPAAAVELPANADVTSLAKRRLKVLIAEDHPINQNFDLVLMDVMMPHMDGVTAVKHLRELEAQGRPHTAVIMVTAHAMTGDRERFLDAGADGYVSKPISAKVLESEITRLT
jgi:CheY-like chemotaxis protein